MWVLGLVAVPNIGTVLEDNQFWGTLIGDSPAFWVLSLETLTDFWWHWKC